MEENQWYSSSSNQRFVDSCWNKIDHQWRSSWHKCRRFIESFISNDRIIANFVFGRFFFFVCLFFKPRIFDFETSRWNEESTKKNQWCLPNKICSSKSKIDIRSSFHQASINMGKKEEKEYVRTHAKMCDMQYINEEMRSSITIADQGQIVVNIWSKMFERNSIS